MADTPVDDWVVVKPPDDFRPMAEGSGDFKPVAPAKPDSDAPGPWPAQTINQARQPPIQHIAGAIGEAFKGPYGPSEETLKPFVSGLPLTAGINRVVLGGGGAALDALGRPAQALVKGSAAGWSEIARALGADETSARKLERDLNLGGDIGMLLGGMSPKMTSAPPSVSRLSKVGRINASDQAKETIGAGFVLPPADATVGHIGETNLANISAGEGGKIKMGQLASAKNQPVVNFHAKTELGLPENTVLSPQVFREVRAREGEVYKEVAAAVPEVDLTRSKDFVGAIGAISDRLDKLQDMFPQMTGTHPEMANFRAELLRNSRGPTQTVMDYLAELRSQATINYQKEGDVLSHRLAAAQREGANAVEAALEDSVKNAPRYYKEKLNEAVATRAEATSDFDYANKSHVTDPNSPMGKQIEMARRRVEETNANVKQWEQRLSNADNKNAENQTLVDRFRDARRTMAKSYDVESVTNVSTGDVNARGLGKLLQDGAHLTDGLKLIADSANSFHRAFQDPAKFGGVESYSVLDIGAGMTAAVAETVAGHPIAGLATGAAAVGARPLMRRAILSRRNQNRMVSDPPVSTPSGVPGAAAQTGAVVGGGMPLEAQMPQQTLNDLGGPP